MVNVFLCGAIVGTLITTAVPRLPSIAQAGSAINAITANVVASSSQASTSDTASGQPAEAMPKFVASSGFFHDSGSKIVDAKGQEVRLTGVNWFGLETSNFAPDGLGARNWQDMMKQMAQAGFNTLRLPYSNQLFDPSSTPNGIDYSLNPDLVGLNGLQIMDKIVDEAGKLGMKIILDRHRPTAAGQSELWYTDKISEDRWIGDWVMLANRYKGNPTVIGADLDNEPHGQATWGDGNTTTDWRLAAERAGDAVLAANPDWLIIVEGVDKNGSDSYWWGGNLEGVKDFPVRLSDPSKLVYSAHEYGPEVYNQPWFMAPNFPNNLTQVWAKHWAFVQQDGIAPLLLGEFGGRSVGQDAEGTWQRTLVQFLKDNNISYTYWCWNPDSGDTGGVLNNDWTTIDAAKMQLLSTYQWPMLDKPKQ